MDIVMTEQRKKIHPQKFTLWIAIGSIVMMFAGLTSAYIIKRNLANWIDFEIPTFFWYSTGALILSSIAMRVAHKAFMIKDMPKYRMWLVITTLLGIVFIILQYFGFLHLWNIGMTLQKNVAFSFLWVIVGLHALHVVGGVIALIVIYLKAFNTKVRVYASLPIEMMSTYWYFVDILWIYLLIFLVLMR
jgi:cytochrome c oxidase subunit III